MLIIVTKTYENAKIEYWTLKLYSLNSRAIKFTSETPYEYIIEIGTGYEHLFRQHYYIIGIVAPWCSGYHYCTTLFNKLILRRFKSCSQRVGDSQWWRSLTKFPGGNKVKRLSLVNHTTITIHHHHHHYHHHHHHH